ncbi:MAG: membrane protein insertase YidC [Flavobacteriales bacterium]
MDRNSIIGFALIAAILVMFTIMNSPSEEEVEAARKEAQARELTEKKNQDSIAGHTPTAEIIVDSIVPAADTLKPIIQVVKNEAGEVIDSVLVSADSLQNVREAERLSKKFGLFYAATQGEAEHILLENDKIIVKLNSKGARISEVRVKGYQSYADYIASPNEINPIQLFDEENSRQNLVIVPTNSNSFVNTEDLFASSSANGTVVAEEGKPGEVEFRFNTTSPNKYLRVTYTLEAGRNDLSYVIEPVGLGDELEKSLILDWNMNGLSTEKLADDERMICGIFYKYFGVSRDYITERTTNGWALEERTEWVAFKHKFFTSAIINEVGFQKKSSKIDQVQLEGKEFTIQYNAQLDASPSLENGKAELQFFFGPNDVDLLASYNKEMENIVNLGWGIFGWTNKYLIIPIFNLLNKSTLNVGLLIILLTLIVKLIILPLTYRNYRSSARMKIIKPEVDKINEKYKDDAVKRQQEQMALYRKTGVNPMAGCIPMLIQMPILIAVFRFFPSSLDLRHERFLWAEDLSSYDSVLTLGFEIPFYGDHVSLFTLLMAASTLIYTLMNSGQMNTSQPGMPNMKVMMYIFPFMMIFFFNSFASGLSFYYLCSNLISIGLMWGVKKFMIDEDKLRLQIEDHKKKPAKKSSFQARLEEMAKQRRGK